MANSTIVMTLKNNIINDLCDDPDIDYLIDSSIYHGKDLKGKHIFNYNKNPETIKETITFLTVMADISLLDRNGTFIVPYVSIYIYSHNRHMELPPEFLNDDEFFNRNDYLAHMIDEKINGNTTYGGYGELRLMENREFIATKDFNGRVLKFKTVDINNSLCDNRW